MQVSYKETCIFFCLDFGALLLGQTELRSLGHMQNAQCRPGRAASPFDAVFAIKKRVSKPLQDFETRFIRAWPIQDNCDLNHLLKRGFTNLSFVVVNFSPGIALFGVG